MKTNIIQIAKTIQSGDVPDASLFSSVMAELVSIKNNCLNKNKFVKYPDANDYKELHSLLNTIPAFQAQHSQPTVWGQFISETIQQIENLAQYSEDIDKDELLSDISKIDGFQEYNNQKVIKQETSLVGLGAFDAMFVSMDNEEAQKANEKEKDFSITKIENTHYARFKSGIVKEESMIDLDNGIIFSATDLLDYIRFNCFLILENEIIQVVASLNSTFDKTQVHVYCLNLDGSIKEEKNATVAQYVDYLKTGAYCKLVRFVENYIVDFNSSIFSYNDNAFVFKGIASILKPKNKCGFFEEYNSKGFEFPLFADYEKHSELRENKLKEDIEFQMKKEGKKEYGDRANSLGTGLRQSNIFLLEDFTNLEKERLLLNVKPRLNVPEFDKVDFTQSLSLDSLLQGNLYKMKALDALEIYSSNISPYFGKELINSQRFFDITSQDIEVKEFAKFKTSTIQENENVVVQDVLTQDLSNYSYQIRDVSTIDDKNIEQKLFGQLFVRHNDSDNTVYPNACIDSDVYKSLLEMFNLTSLREESFIFDQRRTYTNTMKDYFEKCGATETSFDFSEFVDDTSIDDIAVFIDYPSVTKDDNIENEVCVFDIRFTDKRYYDDKQAFEDFENIRITKIVQEELLKEKELFENIQPTETPNSAIFVFKKEKEDSVKDFFNKFNKITKQQTEIGDAV